MSAPRPWWASDDRGAPDEGDLGPVEAHRAARLGERRVPGGPGGTSGSDEPAGSGAGSTGQGASGDAAFGGESHHGDGPTSGQDERRRGSVDDPSPAGHAAEICGVCPICMLARAVGESNPELLGHLAQAARHLAAAARTLLEPSAPPAEPEDRPRDRVQRIDLDP